MSGPKVVRIVTKQEIMANCQDQIDVLRDVIAQWRNYAIKHDALTSHEEKAIDNRLRSILKMYEREQFNDMRANCSTTISIIRADMVRIRNEAMAKAEQERNMRRRLQYSAETLIGSFEVAGRQIPDELIRISSTVLTADESNLATISSKLSQILTEYTISEAENKCVTPLQMELSKQLSEGERLQTLADWKLRHDLDAKAAESDRRLDKLLAEIQIINNEAMSTQFSTRVASIAKQTSPKERSLLTDSLIFDLTAYLNKDKEKEQEMASFRETHIALSRLKNKQAKEIEVLLSQAIASGDITLGKKLKEQASALIMAEKKALIGVSRRQAILKGLAELGYEVRENMATVWAEDGRIVVKKPNDKDYGVELGAVQDVERVQVQLVSFEQSNDSASASRDLDRETIWCSEFSNLNLLLQKAGTSLHIEKALPVGAKPLKKIKEAAELVSKERGSKTSFSRKQLQDSGKV